MIFGGHLEKFGGQKTLKIQRNNVVMCMENRKTLGKDLIRWIMRLTNPDSSILKKICKQWIECMSNNRIQSVKENIVGKGENASFQN